MNKAIANSANRGSPPAVDARRYGRVAVLMGGTSAERAVSLETGTAVCAALQRMGVDAQTVERQRECGLGRFGFVVGAFLLSV